MWPLKTILFFCLYWGGCLTALVNPIWGVITYMMVYLVHPSKEWWGQPVAALDIRFSLVAAASTVFGMLFGRFLLRRKNVPEVGQGFCAWEFGAAVLVAIAGLSLVLGVGLRHDQQANDSSRNDHGKE